MYIKEIEFENFKSFEGKHKITCEKGFNCITGANGSGKSNIIDGIKFVFGFLNVKPHDKDGLGLISNNCDKDEASVKIICVDENNNSEFSVKRVINRNMGNFWLNDEPPKRTMLYNDKNFYINDESVGLSEFYSFLEKYDIKPNICHMSKLYEFNSYNLNILKQDEILGIMEDTNAISEYIIKCNPVEEKEMYLEALKTINSDFSKIYELLSNKKCEFCLESQSASFTNEISISYKPKKYTELTNLEKFHTTLAFIFAIQKYIKIPFCVIEGIDFCLDKDNIERLADYIKNQSKDKQYIVVSLQKTMLENANNIITLNKKD